MDPTQGGPADAATRHGTPRRPRPARRRSRVAVVLVGLSVVAGLWVPTGTSVALGRSAPVATVVDQPVAITPRAAPAPERAVPSSHPRAPLVRDDGSAPSWTWPVSSRVVLRPFVPPVHDHGPGHRGVDLAAEVDAVVVAPAAGTVVFAGQVAGRGVVTIDHGGGVRSSYDSVTPGAEVGTEVDAGTPIARVAVGHCTAQDPCLHLGVRVEDRYVDPLAWLGPAAWPVLLPLGDQTPAVRRGEPWAAVPRGGGAAGGPTVVQARGCAVR